MNCVRAQVSIASGFSDQWCWELYFVEGVKNNGIMDGFINVIGEPHGDCLLTGFCDIAAGGGYID